MSNTNVVTNPGVSASGEVDSLLIEKFNNKVHEAFDKQENLMRYFDINEVQGTDMVSDKHLGDTELQVLSPGEDPEATTTEFEKNALVIDTIVISRNAVATLHDVQNDIEGLKSKLASNQAGKLKKLEDEMLIQQMIYGALTNNSTVKTRPRVSGTGYSELITISDAQSNDPNNLRAAIELTLERMLTGVGGDGDGVDVMDMMIAMPWENFNVLRDAERIVNGDYQTYAGDTVSGFVLKSYNIPVFPSNRFPKNVGGNVKSGTSILSNAQNGGRYTASLAQTNSVALIFEAEALLVGRTISLQGDIFFDKRSKSWFIDTWFAEGAIPGRWDKLGMVQKGGSENTTVTDRAARFAKVTRSLA